MVLVIFIMNNLLNPISYNIIACIAIKISYTLSMVKIIYTTKKSINHKTTLIY